MRVIVNRLAALGMKTGIGHYTVELLRCLEEQAEPGSIVAYPSGWLRHVREAAGRMRPKLEGRGGGPGSPTTSANGLVRRVRRELVGQLRHAGRTMIGCHFRALCARENLDLYHETNFIPLRSSCRTLATIHDLSVINHPEWHPADRVAFFDRHFFKGLAQCEHFFAISEFGRQEIIQKLGMRQEDVTCTYMGIRAGLCPLPKSQVKQRLAELGLPSSYLLYLGTLEPRKNLLLLMRAYCRLPAELRRRYPLLMVGGWGWNAGEVAEFLNSTGRHMGILHLGYVAEQQISTLYNGARALLFPSYYEGFGLPPVEMLACGGAVLASTAGAIVETVGEKAHLIPPDDEAEWTKGMKLAIEDEDWVNELRRDATVVAKPYTWDRCAAQTLEVYRRLTQSSVSSDSSARGELKKAA